MIKLLINVLGKIETTFQNVKTFWDIQTFQCENLNQLRFVRKSMAKLSSGVALLQSILSGKLQLKIEKLQKKDEEVYVNQAKRELRKSTFKWLTLLKINHDAFLAIEVSTIRMKNPSFIF